MQLFSSYFDLRAVLSLLACSSVPLFVFSLVVFAKAIRPNWSVDSVRDQFGGQSDLDSGYELSVASKNTSFLSDSFPCTVTFDLLGPS